MANGELSEEQADLIADASEQSNGDAARDHDFINAIANADPDQGKRIRDEWINRHTTAGQVETEHQRQRRLRRLQTYTAKRDGLAVTSLHGDSIASKAIEEAIRQRADEIYRRDGGRDLPADQHPRTRAQREFDAAYELLCNITTTPHGTAHTPAPAAAADPAANDTSPDNPGGAGATKACSCGRSTQIATRREPARPSIVIAWTLDDLIAGDPAQLATQIGHGLIPHRVLADHTAHADIIAALYNHNGEQLWQSRLTRYATATQYIALVIRDQGCVLCRAPHTQCDPHHLTPWNAPARGQTNLDNLALLCKACHHQLHANNHTLYQHPNTGHWHTRPASPTETPPTRIPRPKRE